MEKILSRHMLITISLICLLLMSCATPIDSVFEGIVPTTDETYGYTAENPIRVGNGKKGFEITRVFLSRLRTEAGDSLKPVLAASVSDPKYKSKILDLWVMVPENTNDTLNLYFDIYHKERIFIPKGLRYVAPDRP